MMVNFTITIFLISMNENLISVHTKIINKLHEVIRMKYLKSIETAMTETISKLEKYVNDENSYSDQDNLEMVDVILTTEMKELHALYSKLVSMSSDLRRKYDDDRLKYKNAVLYGRRLAKIFIDRQKERTYHKADKGYKQVQHTHYKFAMEVATENGIIIHRDSRECVWKGKQTKEDNLIIIRNKLNREYFVEDKDIEVVEA